MGMGSRVSWGGKQAEELGREFPDVQRVCVVMFRRSFQIDQNYIGDREVKSGHLNQC